MKTIKINDNSVDDDFKDTHLVRLRDVLELLNECPDKYLFEDLDLHKRFIDLVYLKSRLNKLKEIN